MGRECQICGGAIVNGRCKFCGMPYRNDEVLYHLNESRSQHYKHATTAARQEIEQRQIPLPDRKKQSGATSQKAKQVQRYDKAKIQKQARKEFGNVKNKKGTAGKIWWIIILIYVVIQFLGFLE